MIKYSKNKDWEDQIPGGFADEKSPEDFKQKKHG